MADVMISYIHLKVILLNVAKLIISKQMVELIYVDVLLFDYLNVVEMFDPVEYSYVILIFLIQYKLQMLYLL